MDHKDDVTPLLQKLETLQAELAAEKRKSVTLEQKISDLEQAQSKSTSTASLSSSVDTAELPTAISEFEETLRRLVQRTAMIVQAEKCVIMVRDRESGDLYARWPAWGMSEEEVRQFRSPADRGLSGEVFHNGKASILQDSRSDERAAAEHLAGLNIRNGVTVPLLIEKRDDENRVVDRVIIGVLHCFNKRYGSEFIEEDVRLLERLSRNAAAVIANAQMYQEVVEEKQKLVHTLESLTSGLILVTPKGRIGQMNAQARAMFQVSRDPIGRPLSEVVQHDQCVTIILRRIEEGISGDHRTDEEREADVDEITVTDQEEEQYIYQVHATEVRDSNDSVIGTVVIFNDITDIRSVERMKTEFVSIVSHELRTPLTPMKGFIETLIQDPNEEFYLKEDRQEFYGIILENVDRLNRLISDLLNVSRIERGVGIEMNWEDDVDIRKAAEAVIDTQKGRTDKHSLVIDFKPEHILAETDPDKIQNILQNFVSNAIKYSDGGEVKIIGRTEGPSEEYPEGAIVLGVKDQGFGLSERDLKKIGEKFFRSDNKKSRTAGGTGIGLFLVKSLILAHNGHMWVESELGKGSTFWFRFPVKQPKSDEDQPAEATMDGHPL